MEKEPSTGDIFCLRKGQTSKSFIRLSNDFNLTFILRLVAQRKYEKERQPKQPGDPEPEEIDKNANKAGANEAGGAAGNRQVDQAHFESPRSGGSKPGSNMEKNVQKQSAVG